MTENDRSDPGPAMWQVGIVVDDIERAKAGLSAAGGVEWTHAQRTIDLDVGDERREITLEIAISRQGPVHLELIEGQEGTPWWPPHGFDHVAYWADDLVGRARELESNGYERQVSYFTGSADPMGFTYHRSAGGFRIEHVDGARREAMMAWIAGGDFPGLTQ